MPTFTTPQEIAEGIQEALDKNGGLVIRHGHGQLRQLKPSEVELLVAALRIADKDAAAGMARLMADLADANVMIEVLNEEAKRTRPEVAEPEGWEPVEWRRTSRKPGDIDDLAVHRMRSPFYEGTRYAVRRHGRCLNKSAEWEYEPMPSSRDDEFYARCRFDSFQEALAVLNRSQPQSSGS